MYAVVDYVAVNVVIYVICVFRLIASKSFITGRGGMAITLVTQFDIKLIHAIEKRISKYKLCEIDGVNNCVQMTDNNSYCCCILQQI